MWPRREALTDNVTPDLLAHVGAGTGDAVLDIGSGGGKVAIAVGGVVGPGGRVVGADVSEALVRLARERASRSGAENVRFEVVDAQKDDIPGAPFSVAMSQFGVMFFDEPVTALANIVRHVGEEGRLAVACWQAMDRNPWALGHAIGAYTPPPPTPAPGKSLTGPFTWGDFTRTAELLAAAGWRSPQPSRTTGSSPSTGRPFSTTASWPSTVWPPRTCRRPGTPWIVISPNSSGPMGGSMCRLPTSSSPPGRGEGPPDRELRTPGICCVT